MKRLHPGLKRFLILFIICGAVIFPALMGEYLQWDDDKNIYKNPWLLDGDILKFWTERYYFLLYIPVTYSFWTALWHLTSDPIAFHVFSLLLHVLNCNWVFLIARKLFPDLKERDIWLITLAFAIMPLQVEAFAWISGGRDLLGLQFSLAALYVFLCSSNRWSLAGSALLFAIGLLSKPTVAPLPVAILALSSVRKHLTKSHWVTLGVWLVLAIADLAWNRSVQDIGLDLNVARVPLADRIVITLDTLGFYASKFAVPWPLNADYARMPWKVMSRQLYWPMLIVLSITIALFVWIQRKLKINTLEFSLFFLIGMSPVLGFIPFMAQAQSTVADRYVYWPWIAFAMMLGLVSTKFKHGFKVMSVWLVVWAGLSFTRSFAWTSDDVLFNDMLSKSPDSFTANNALGAFAFQRGQYAEAELKFKAAHEVMPHRAGVISNLVQLYWQMGKRDKILTEIEPFLRNDKWVGENGPEYIPLSVIFLVVGRTQHLAGRHEDANISLCRSYAINPDYFSAKLEILRTLDEIKKATGKVIECIPR